MPDGVRSATILLSEQASLSLVGMALGCCAMLIYKGLALADVSADILLFAILYFTAILAAGSTCSVLATRRSVLEMLQVKE